MKNITIITLSCLLVTHNTIAQAKPLNYSPPENIQQTNHEKLQSSFPGNWVTMGTSVFKDAEFPVSFIKCVDTNPSKISLSNPQGQINMDNTVTKEHLSSFFGFGSGINASWNIFSASVSAKYLHTITDDTYTQNFTYLQTVTGTTILNSGYGEDKVLNETGKAAFADGEIAFKKLCGDAFVSEAQAGILLSVNLKLLFKSSADKQNFNAAISGEIAGIAGISQTLQKAKTKSNVSASVIVNAIQMGGNPENLAKIFKKSNDGYYISTCSMDHLDDCNQVINGVIEYAQNLGAQIKTSDGKDIDKTKLYYGSPVFTLYNIVGVKIPKVSFESNNILQLVEIMQRIESQTLTINHYISLMTDSLEFQAMKDDLNVQLDHLNNRKRYLANVAETCFTIDKTSNVCQSALEEADRLFMENNFYYVYNEAIEDLKYAWHYQNPITDDLKHDVIFRPLTFGKISGRPFYGIDKIGHSIHKLYLNALGNGLNQLAGWTQLNNAPYFDICDFLYGLPDMDYYQHGYCTNVNKKAKFASRIRRIYNPEM